MAENIVLVGMMGVGKTAVGRLLAEELAFDFVDLDAELEQVTGLKLPEYIENTGKFVFIQRISCCWASSWAKQPGVCCGRRAAASGGAPAALAADGLCGLVAGGGGNGFSADAPQKESSVFA